MGRYAFRSRRRVLVGVTALVAVVIAGFAVVLAGPGGGSGGTAAVTGPVASGEGAVGGPEVATDSAGGGSGPSDQAVTGPRAAPAQGVPVGVVGRSLVHSAQLAVVVDDPAAQARQVRTAAAAAGGLVAQEQAGDGGAWLVLRVPADVLNRLLDTIAELGAVVGRASQTVDATEEVVDLDARVASQHASVARVRALLAQAATIGEVVAVEAELARREADLDSLTSRLAALRDQVAMSTLTVDLRETGDPLAGDDDTAAGFLDGLATGWAGLRALVSAVAAVVGFLLPFMPVVLVLGVIAWSARRLVRARRTPAPAGGATAGCEAES